MPRLTVAIPTFDRNAILQRHLALLLPQLTADCSLLIIDNCSPTPVSETLEDLLAAYPNVSVRVERNRHNIGGGANITRCLEWCDGDWLWVLSDDDLPKPDAIETILRNIDTHPDCIYFNFATIFRPREENFTSAGLEEFVEKLDDFGNVVFISTGIYKVSAVAPQLKYGYIYCYSWAPYVAMLIHTLGSTAQCFFSAEHIVEYHPADEKRWSYINWGLGMGTLLDAPMNPAIRKKLAKKIVRSALLDFAVFIELVSGMNGGRMTRREAWFIYDQICARIYYFERGIMTSVRLAIFRMMLWFPRLTYTVFIAGLRYVRRRKGKNENVEAHWAPDRLTGV